MPTDSSAVALLNRLYRCVLTRKRTIAPASAPAPAASPSFEPLEKRELLSATFASFEREPGESTREVQFAVLPEDFTLAGGSVRLGFDLLSADPNASQPSGELRTAGGGVVTPVLESGGRLLADLGPGRYVLSLDDTDDGVRVDVSLIGDLDGDGDVDAADVGGIRALQRAGGGDGDANPGADANSDGRITAVDFREARLNRGAATTIGVLGLTADLANTPTETNADGVPVVQTPTIELVGTTTPGVGVEVSGGVAGSLAPLAMTTAGSDGSWSATVALGVGTNALAVEAFDGFGQRATASLEVSLETEVGNTPPVASSTDLESLEGAPVEIDLAGLVEDAETADADLVFALSGATGGTAELLADGRTTRFTPEAGFTGAASFAYSVTDTGFGTAAPITVGPVVLPVAVLIVDPANTPPRADPADLSTDRTDAREIDLATLVEDDETADADLTFTVGDAVNGTVELLADGRTARFTADAGSATSASFTYTVTDEPFGFGPAETVGPVTINVAITDEDVNTPPVATSTDLTTEAGTPVDTDLAALVTDAETADADLVFTVADASNGTVELLADGRTARFTPDAGFEGAASFAYAVTDTAVGTAAAETVGPIGIAVSVAATPVGAGIDLTITPPAELTLDGRAIENGFFTVTSAMAFDQALTMTVLDVPEPVAATIGSGKPHFLTTAPAGTRVVSLVGFFDPTNPDLPRANFNYLIGSITNGATNLGFTAHLPNNTADSAFQVTNLGASPSLSDNGDRFASTDAKPTLNLSGGDFAFDNGTDSPIFVNLTAIGDGSAGSAGQQPHGTITQPRGARPVVIVDEGGTATNGGVFVNATADLVSVSATSGTAELDGDRGFTWTEPAGDGPDDTRYVVVTGQTTDGGTVSVGYDVLVENVAPVADAGGPYVTGGSAAITLAGTATDAGADDLDFAWDLDGDGLFDDADVAAPSFDASGLAAGESTTVTLRVTDDDGATDTDAATVRNDTVVNRDPVADAGGPYAVRIGETIVLDGSATDADGDDLSFAWSFDQDNTFDDAFVADPTFDATGLTPGFITVDLRVTDAAGNTDRDNAALQVLPANIPPTADAGGPYTVGTDGTVQLSGIARDRDNGPLVSTWDLDGDGAFDDATGTGPVYDANAFGLSAGDTATVTLRVDDGRGGVTTDTATVTRPATPVSVGTLLSSRYTTGEISVPGERDEFTIAVKAGDDLLVSIDEIDASFGPQIDLLDPEGNLVASESDSFAIALRDADLTRTGLYTIVVRGLNGSVGAYGLTAVASSGTQVDAVALDSGDFVTGVLRNGEIDTYLIDASAGDDILLSIDEINTSVSPEIFLYAPDGSLVLNASDSFSEALRAADVTQDGTYLIAVRDLNGFGLGEYGLGAVVSDGAQSNAVAIDSGDYVTNVLRNGEIDTYLIDASAGDDILLSIDEINTSVSPEIFLYAPDGSLVLNASDSFSEALRAADVTQDGTYLIAVRDLNGFGLGEYGLGAVVSDGAQSNAVAIDSGDYVTNVLRNGEIDTYLIDASAGDDILLSIDEINTSVSPEIFLYAPDGSLVLNASDSFSEALRAADVTQDGTYLIAVRDLNGFGLGEYGLGAVVSDGAQPNAVALDSGDFVTGVLRNGEIDTYLIDASAGDDILLSIDEINTSVSPEIFLYAPDGSLVLNASDSFSEALRAADVTQDGTYLIAVRDLNGFGLGEYGLGAVVSDGAQPNAVALDSGDFVTGVLRNGEIDTYLLDADAGGNIAFEIAEIDSAVGPEAFLYAPDGSLVLADADSFTATINATEIRQTGTYLIAVRDLNGFGIGRYELNFL